MNRLHRFVVAVLLYCYSLLRLHYSVYDILYCPLDSNGTASTDSILLNGFVLVFFHYLFGACVCKTKLVFSQFLTVCK